MQTPNSPLFPPQQLTLSPSGATFSSVQLPNSSQVPDDIPTYLPQLPDKPLASTGGIQVYIIPAEKNLYVQGFEAHEYAERPPTILRGCLYLRITKSSKIKSITLTFKGTQRTDWPEGIPPKKTQFAESTDIINHTWPFLQPGSIFPNNGADVFQELSNNSIDHDISHLSLGESRSRGLSPAPTMSDLTVVPTNGTNPGGNFLTRSLSPATNFMRRATSPSVSSMDGPPDLSSIISPSNNSEDSTKPATFQPGDYIYNFEQPLQASIPETCSVTFGTVSYHLEASIVRPGTFKSNLIARMPIQIIRTPAEQNLEEHESIVITRDWEDQLKYDIVIGSKSIVLDSYLPLAFRFVPLFGKVSLHRIRVYLTENLEYFCKNKKVHRLEPVRKYLLLEHKAEKGKSLLNDNSDKGEDEFIDMLPKELEFQVYVPKIVNDRTNNEIHPDTSYENIQSHHWIKICLRISRLDPENPDKRKHYEISIDSPLHVLSPLAAHGNTSLPAYDDFIARNKDNTINYNLSPPTSPGVIPIDNTSNAFRNASLNNSNNFLTVLNQSPSNNGGNSLDEIMERRPRSASASPAPFTRLNNHSYDESPIVDEADMHLEANLYKPKVINQLHSPQAFPHPGTFTSPLNSPVQRPIHIIRRPSINPPPFDADIAPPPAEEIMPPPAYEAEDPALSLSPLRIDEPSTNSNSNSSSNSNSEMQRNQSNQSNNSSIPAVSMIVPTIGSSETPVKSLLQQQLRNSRPSLDSRHSGSSKSISSKKSMDSASSHKSNSTANTTSNSNLLVVADDDEEQDIVDYPSSPIIPPRTLSPRRVFHSEEVDEEFENNENPSIVALNQSNSINNQLPTSRRTSVSSYTSVSTDIIPVEQTIPLLSLSNASMISNLTHSEGNNGIRNQSVSSLLNDANFVRRGSQITGLLSTRINEFLEGGDLGEEMNKINGSLLNLRNPRIKKHYQDDSSSTNQTLSEGIESEEVTLRDVESDATSVSVGTEPRERQKSFGVIHTPVGHTSEGEEQDDDDDDDELDAFVHTHAHNPNESQSSAIVHELPPVTNTNKPTRDDGVPGFKYSYVI
ncbi:uncharacterized protein RJT21DRAFT_130074 [Scheffersomyces amazonensis]|uniref:uncharacterized protein n=1 Tax=Scheffersomyces amazonensis TaxID=1078765 RepID=UPI00315CD595